jgi:hypothetical protein
VLLKKYLKEFCKTAPQTFGLVTSIAKKPSPYYSNEGDIRVGKDQFSLLTFIFKWLIKVLIIVISYNRIRNNSNSGKISTEEC